MEQPEEPTVTVVWWGPARGAPPSRDRLEVHETRNGECAAVLVVDREIAFIAQLPRRELA